MKIQYCKTCGHSKEEHNRETKQCSKEGCICPSFKYDLSADLAMLGITAGIGGLLSSMFLSEGKKMFGMGSGDVEIKAKDVMYVMIDGFMGYYQEKEREIIELKEKLERIEDELAQTKEHYEEMKCLADKHADIAKEWKDKYNSDKDRELEQKCLMLNDSLVQAQKEAELWKKKYSGLASTHMKFVKKGKK